MTGKRVIITGGTGGLGGAVVDALLVLEREESRSPGGYTGTIERLARLISRDAPDGSSELMSLPHCFTLLCVDVASCPTSKCKL